MNLPLRRIVMSGLGHRCLSWSVALIATLLALSSVWTGLLFDDYMQRTVLLGDPVMDRYAGSRFGMFDFADGDPGRTRALMDLGVMPWWAHEKVRLTFCRPVTVLTHLLDYRLWPQRPALMHLHNLLWFATLVLVVALVYRRFIGPGWVAGLAALLYAVDDAHAMPAGWIANRNGVLGALFGMLALLAHDRWRKDGSRAAGVMAPGCLVLGLLSNEGAIAATAYLFAYALFLDEGRWTRRALSLAPYAIIVVVWRVVYSALGYGVWGSELYIDPLHSPSRFLAALWHRVPVLFLAQWAAPPSDFFIFLPTTAKVALCVAGVALILWVLGSLAPLLRTDRVARFWAVGMALALIPICATFPMDRLLLFVGIGAMGLVAQFIAMVSTPPGEGTANAPRSPLWRACARPLYIVLIVVHLVIAPLLFPVRFALFAGFSNRMAACIQDAPMDETIAAKTLVIPSAPNVFYTSYFPPVRAVKRQPMPGQIRTLGPNTGLPVPVHITRTDAHTLVVEPESGFPWFLVRDADHPLPPGTTIALDGMSVDVMSVAKAGWPRRVAYRFDVPLEDPGLVWLNVENNVYVPWQPPEVGQSVTLNEK